MSMYNMIYGVNSATFFFLPMLGQIHPDDYPRFRDCFLGKMTRSKTEKDEYDIPLRELSDDKVITVFTRTGGPNREDYELENTKLKTHPNYIEDYDDSFDNTFACFVFSIPDEWKEDYEIFIGGDPKDTSDKYKQRVFNTFPKAIDKLKKTFE